MILWGLVVGALVGWCAAGFDTNGLVLGALSGAIAGLGLRKAVRAEIARALAEGVLTSAPISTVPPPPSEKVVAPPIEDPSPDRARQAPELESFRPAPLPAGAATGAPPEDDRPNLVEIGLASAKSWLLGGNTIVRAGLVILFIGLAFLARFAAQHALFPVELRLALVMLAGVALLGVGFSRRHAKPAFALALEGTGVAVIYLTIFAAARLFTLIPPVPAFAVMIVVCVLGCALAVLQNAQSLAVASFVGGFAVPVLLADGQGSTVVLFGYYTVLNLAVLLIGRWRSWRIVNLVGFVATFGVATAWGVLKYEPAQYAVAQPFLIGFVLIYIAAALLNARDIPDRIGNAVDSTLLFGPALAGFGLQVGLVRHLPYGSAFSALGFGAVYLGLALVARRRGDERDPMLRDGLIAIGVGFATVAIPLALGARWTSSAWALEGAAAFWVGMRQSRWLPRLFGVTLQGVAALVFVASIDRAPVVGSFLDPALLGAVLVALPLLITARWLARPQTAGASRFAEAYAAIETTLEKPFFVAGFAFWWLAFVIEATATLPPARAGGATVALFSVGLQPLLVMLAFVVSAGIAAMIGRRLDWRVATWPSFVTLLPIALVLIEQVASGRHVLVTPAWLVWLPAIGLHLVLLHAADRERRPSRAFRGAVHVGSVWLLVVWLADCLYLAIDRSGLWATSWAGVVLLLSATLALAGLTATATRGGSRWPLHAFAASYYWVAAVSLAAFVALGVLGTAVFDPGRADPLPYVPLFNPLELALALGVGVLVLWRRTIVDKAPPGSGWAATPRALAGLALLTFIVINTVWLRIAHHFLDVAWTIDAMLKSFVVQTGLAILWTVLALVLMVVAHRRGRRDVWLVGAGLLALVVAKLLLVDLANAGGGERVVTFLAVGVLMLVTGYFAPLPPARASEDAAA